MRVVYNGTLSVPATSTEAVTTVVTVPSGANLYVTKFIFSRSQLTAPVPGDYTSLVVTPNESEMTEKYIALRHAVQLDQIDFDDPLPVSSLATLNVLGFAISTACNIFWEVHGFIE